GIGVGAGDVEDATVGLRDATAGAAEGAGEDAVVHGGVDVVVHLDGADEVAKIDRVGELGLNVCGGRVEDQRAAGRRKAALTPGERGAVADVDRELAGGGREAAAGAPVDAAAARGGRRVEASGERAGRLEDATGQDQRAVGRKGRTVDDLQRAGTDAGRA